MSYEGHKGVYTIGVSQEKGYKDVSHDCQEGPYKDMYIPMPSHTFPGPH